jgi:hypothetical protein
VQCAKVAVYRWAGPQMYTVSEFASCYAMMSVLMHRLGFHASAVGKGSGAQVGRVEGWVDVHSVNCPVSCYATLGVAACFC